MAIQKEIWAADIAEKLFPNDSWLTLSVDETVLSDGKAVHRSQAGVLPTVVRNRNHSATPATAALRADADYTYTLDELTTDPIKVPDIEQTEVNYNKRQSVLSNHVKVLNVTATNWILYNWLATQSANIVRTTGTASANALAPGATGTRKNLTIDDWLNAKSIMDDMDIDDMNRQAVVPSFMLNQFILENKTLLLNLTQQGDAVFSNGNLQNIFGFRIHTRGKKNIPTYTNAATPVRRTPADAALVTANAAVHCWHPDFVARAKGEVKVFSDLGNPLYYGDVFSALVRCGGEKIYSDETGCVTIVQAP